MEQISLLDVLNNEIGSEIHSLYKSFCDALIKTDRGYDLSVIKEERRTPEKTDAYDVMLIGNVTIFKTSGKKEVKLNVSPRITRIMKNNGINVEQQKTGWSRVDFKDINFNSDPYIAEQIYEDILAENGFGCCSRYVECSDAKRCVNPDIMLAVRCAYRKNLKVGKIFYGKNAVINKKGEPLCSE